MKARDFSKTPGYRMRSCRTAFTLSSPCTWTGNKQIPRAASTNPPSLAIFNGSPVLCFKGGTNDDGIYSSTYHPNTASWAPVTHTGPFGTSKSPTLAVYQGKLFMAWKGASDTGLYWSITTNNLNPNAWSGQANISNVGSEAGPAAVVYCCCCVLELCGGNECVAC
jgi:hypothetical protein